VILDVHLPPVAYRRLVGRAPTLSDLAELSPSLARGLAQLLDYQARGVIENNHSTGVEPPPPPPPAPRVCMSVHPEGKSRSDLGWSACCE